MKKVALLVIDVQNGMFPEGEEVFKGERLLRNINELLTRARAIEIPVVYVQHNEPIGKQLEYGTNPWKIHSSIAPQNQDIIIQKTTPDSFFNTTLHDELKKQEIEHLIIAGIQTELCVDTTCRRAFSLGYKVTLVSDGHSTWDSGELTAEQIINHHNSLLRWFADIYPSKDIKFH
ncbi:Nicotinamidase-related amidase [Psychrobacillus sp. OK028]|uniref:cysteine hydrolase family protein n=1 Tax=Psychrobacillus sp. OK028 TaxID=1884359 RepID=UPI0008850476|nr:cysteine hydrolase family protein [Psychrobacillus sp. OK028]SDM73013.1 Nicotinamidase-related amidase [Psychrobacillus sp. OK028]